MKIIFFGTPNFASEILKSIYKEHKVLSIVTAEDSQKGRGNKYKSPSVKLIAAELKIPVIQPKNLKDPHFIDQLPYLFSLISLIIIYILNKKIIWVQIGIQILC